jgi:ferrous iron transport protein B
MSRELPLVALVGNPNAGKSALFNALSGARQKIANYPGVTVERKSGRIALPDGRPVELVDLPGAYSLTPDSLDEKVTRDVVLGEQDGESRPDALIIVVDAGNLENHLRFALELIALQMPTVIALNMVDLATRDGLQIDPSRLCVALGVPVVSTVAVRKLGLDDLKLALAEIITAPNIATAGTSPVADSQNYNLQAKKIARDAIVHETASRQWTRTLDGIFLHPILGPIILMTIMFVMFQAVFSWSQAPVSWIEWLFAQASNGITAVVPAGLARSLLIDGVIAGVGAVVVFLPQILILFAFILTLESTGYMTRAAFVMDRLMAAVGLSGHSFIPLLSSFACAIPGIMATRTIMDQKDRLTTILIAPLMTCSARLPVYTLIIGAFIPARSVGLGVGLQGLVLFGLYMSGILGAMAAGFVIRRSVAKGSNGSFLIEMPRYQLPRLRDFLLGLWQRAWLFLRRAGTIIFASTIILWALLSFPQSPDGSKQSQAEYSIAGRIAGGLEIIVRPIGFNREIALALIPAMAAREVAVSALATTYAIDASDEEKAATSLSQKLSGKWSLATALAFLVWFVFAPQCISTIAVTKRETNGWKWPIFMVSYLFALAYVGAGITYWTATALGL